MLWRQRSDAASKFDVSSRRIGTGQEIMSISQYNVDGSTRLITGTRDKRAQLWALDSKLNITSIFSVELPTSIPRALYFLGSDIVVFGMYDGEIHTLRCRDGLLLSTKSTGLMIGAVALDRSGGYFVVDNAVSGFGLHRLDDGVCVRSYDTKPTKTYPKQVAFAEQERVIIGGGEKGMVHIFDKTTGSLVQTLSHSHGGLVQTITAHDDGSSSLVIAASSGSDADANAHISVWKKQYSLAQDNATNTWPSFRTALQVMSHLLTILVVVILVVQSMHPHVRGRETNTLIDVWNNLWHESNQPDTNGDVQMLLQQLVEQVEQQIPDTRVLPTRRREDRPSRKGPDYDIGKVRLTMPSVEREQEDSLVDPRSGDHEDATHRALLEHEGEQGDEQGDNQGDAHDKTRKVHDLREYVEEGTWECSSVEFRR
ncbi:WD40-repeat-containing domain protein [Chiua virens]|nr:WD40-repeat-containing domain protein [Chiua virens]